MEKENRRENLSEMEQIHRGLEAFLEKEVYEEYEAGQNAGPGGAERYEEFDGYDENEEYREQDVYDESDEYGEYWKEDENNDYEEYEDEEPVRTAMARQSINRTASRQSASTTRTGAGAGRPGRKEQTSQSQGNGRGHTTRGQSSGQAQTAQHRENGRDKTTQGQSRGQGQTAQHRENGRGKTAQRQSSGQVQTAQRKENSKGQTTQSKGNSKGQTSRRQGNGGEQPSRKKKHKVLRRFLAVVLVLLLAVTGLWYITVSHLYDKVEYTPTEILADQPMKEEGVTNILLIGNDSRVNGEDGRSDAMILVSISNQTKTIYLTSLLRDIYVEIPGHESNRLNAAYAFGGPELLLETIKQNLDIEVNRYVQVNFQAFANLIDAVGGVDLELTNDEVQLVNAYLNEYNMLENRPIDTDYLPTDASGLLHLNGPQALAYSRNRYIGSDFGRTERQRKILEAVFHQLPSSMLTNSGDLIDGILPNLTTNISKSECYALSLDATKLLTYELVQASIPIAGSYQSATIRKMSVLQVDFEKNKEFIRTQIYGEEAVQ